MKDRKTVRCAIYTRKSTEEGLDQAFNSLDAQREACAAYIDSQRHEGWKAIRVAYDDGGYSGGTMDRPGLQNLLRDIDAGLVDVVVVYKIDRLTRSLSDFAKIVDRFEKRSASFVSVTQSFNTTSSMGRLTLNVLLSFAQFEREVTAERIRDKIAASRKRGIFMGGCPPLGYDARDRKLVINETEAATVRMIFERYLDLRSVGRLRNELETKGITPKAWVSVSGKQKGGGRWYVGPLRHVLRNRVYAGEAVHKGAAYAGEHQPLVSRDVFDRVQRLLDGNRVAIKQRIVRQSPGLLTGLIHDDRGNAMTPQESKNSNGTVNVYYVSQALLQHRKDAAGSLARVPAKAIEPFVVQRLQRLVGELLNGLETPEARDRALREGLRRFVKRVTVALEAVTVEFSLQPFIDAKARAKSFDAFAKCLDPNEVLDRGQDSISVLAKVRLKTFGGVKRIEGWSAPAWTSIQPRFNRPLLTALAHAHRWREQIELGEVTSLDALASQEAVDRKQLRLVLRLAFLPPDVQRAIVLGHQPQNLSLTGLLNLDLPPLWAQQRELFGAALRIAG